MGAFIIQAINVVFYVYWFAIIARAFLPLVGADMRNPVIRFVFDITEPVLAPLRRFSVVGMWDLSPIVAIILLTIVQQLLISFVLNVFH
jgi:YggT family protein